MSSTHLIFDAPLGAAFLLLICLIALTRGLVLLYHHGWKWLCLPSEVERLPLPRFVGWALMALVIPLFCLPPGSYILLLPAAVILAFSAQGSCNLWKMGPPHFLSALRTGPFAAMAWALPLFGIYLLSESLLHQAGFDFPLQPGLDDLQISRGIPHMVVASLLIIVVAPVAEEMIFRGFLYPVFKTVAGRWGATLIAALFFAWAHHYPPAAPALFVLGIALTLLYEKTGSLLHPMAAHAAYNLISVTLFLISQRHE